LQSVQEFLGISKDQLEHGLALHKKFIVVDPISMSIESQVWSDSQI